MRSEKVKKILIRSVNWIGDAVMTTPAISAIRKKIPDAHISVLAKPWVRDVFLNNPDIDEIIVYLDRGIHRGFSGRWRLVRELRKRKFDMTFLFQNAFESALITFLAGIPRRIGYNTDGRGLLLSDSVEIHQKGKRLFGCYGLRIKTMKMHHVEYYLELIRSVGIDGSGLPLVFNITDEEQIEADRLLRNEGVEDGDLIVGINPGASYGPAKRWFPERYAMLSDRVVEEFSAKVVIFGGINEVRTAEEIAGITKYKPVIMAGRTTLRELGALVKRCSVFVTNDSGSMHIAAALNVPVVALFGSTDPDATGPWGSRHIVIKKGLTCSPCFKKVCSEGYRCMDLITVDEVLESVKLKLLELKC